MKHILLKAALSAAIVTAAIGNAGAQAITVTKATVQREVSASDPHHSHDEMVFNIVWNSATPPADIFFRADAAHWLRCKMTRSVRKPFGGGPNDYMIMDNHAQPGSLKKGEAINLRPEQHPSEVQPDEVKKMPVSALFYQLEGSKKWVAQKVKPERLKDLPMP